MAGSHGAWLAARCRDDTIYVYCFKGSRAALVMVALTLAGFRDVRNYFASWNEWSRDPALPIETGAPGTRAIAALGD